MAPVQFKWFQFLSRAFPITKTAGFSPVMKRVSLDQLIMAPTGQRPRDVSMIEPVMFTDSCYRLGLLLHVHDCGRGRWKACCGPQISRRISSSTESQLCHLAYGSNFELQSPSPTISAGELKLAGSGGPTITLTFYIATRVYRQHRMDRISVDDKLRRGGVRHVPERKTVYLCR